MYTVYKLMTEISSGLALSFFFFLGCDCSVAFTLGRVSKKCMFDGQPRANNSSMGVRPVFAGQKWILYFSFAVYTLYQEHSFDCNGCACAHFARRDRDIGFRKTWKTFSWTEGVCFVLLRKRRFSLYTVHKKLN